MKSKNDNKISMIIYEDQTIPYLRKIKPTVYKFFLYAPTVILLLSITVMIGSLLYIKNIESVVRSKEPEIIRALRTENSLLQEKAEELSLLNKEFTKKLSSTTASSSMAALDLIAPVIGQTDLTNPASVNIQDMKSEVVGDKIYFRFNIVNNTSDGSKLSGHIHIFVTDGNTYQKYPISVEQPENFSIKFSDGEYFATSRFRPVEAIFKKMDRSTLIYKIIIFNRVGDLIHQQLYKEGLN